MLRLDTKTITMKEWWENTDWAEGREWRKTL